MGLITSKHDAKQATQVITGSCYQKILGLDIMCISVLNIQSGFCCEYFKYYTKWYLKK